MLFPLIPRSPADEQVEARRLTAHFPTLANRRYCGYLVKVLRPRDTYGITRIWKQRSCKGMKLGDRRASSDKRRHRIYVTELLARTQVTRAKSGPQETSLGIALLHLADVAMPRNASVTGLVPAPSLPHWSPSTPIRAPFRSRSSGLCIGTTGLFSWEMPKHHAMQFDTMSLYRVDPRRVLRVTYSLTDHLFIYILPCGYHLSLLIGSPSHLRVPSRIGRLSDFPCLI